MGRGRDDLEETAESSSCPGLRTGSRLNLPGVSVFDVIAGLLANIGILLPTQGVPPARGVPRPGRAVDAMTSPPARAVRLHGRAGP